MERERPMYVRRDWDRKKAGSVEGWSVCDLSSWANPRISVPPNRKRPAWYSAFALFCIILRRVFPDSEMRRSDILSLPRIGKQDRKWADYRSASTISPATGWMHEKEFILGLVPTGDHFAGSCFITAKLLQKRKTLEVEYYLQVRRSAVLEKFEKFLWQFLSHYAINDID